MIKGTNKNDNELAYREMTLDSSSSLKDFSFDRKKYYRKYILNEDVEDKESQAIIMGKLVETLLWQPELFDDKFHMSACMSAPTGLMLEFVEALYEFTKEATDESGNVTLSFEDLSRMAYEKSGFKIKYEAVINKFLGSDAEIYYKEIRTIRAKGLTVVTATDTAIAEKIVEELKTNPVTKPILDIVDSVRYTVRVQFQIEDYEVDGHKFKSMFDLVIVDHVKQTIQVYDLKCVWAVENFFEEYYLYRRAYIQAYLYFKAATHLRNINEEYEGYTVSLPRFIVCDSTNYLNPLIYTLDANDLIDAYDGFEYKGRKYPGVRDIIKDLKWALENNTWNISRENSEADGIVKLRR